MERRGGAGRLRGAVRQALRSARLRAVRGRAHPYGCCATPALHQLSGLRPEAAPARRAMGHDDHGAPDKLDI